MYMRWITGTGILIAATGHYRCLARAVASSAITKGGKERSAYATTLYHMKILHRHVIADSFIEARYGIFRPRHAASLAQKIQSSPSHKYDAIREPTTTPSV